jgi:hypothetical protein
MNVFKLEEFQSQKPFFTTKTDEFQGTVYPCVCMYVFVCVCVFVHLIISQSVCTSFCLDAFLNILSGCYEYTALFMTSIPHLITLPQCSSFRQLYLHDFFLYLSLLSIAPHLHFSCLKCDVLLSSC